jgi:hypothetical protein
MLTMMNRQLSASRSRLERVTADRNECAGNRRLANHCESKSIEKSSAHRARLLNESIQTAVRHFVSAA